VRASLAVKLVEEPVTMPLAMSLALELLGSSGIALTTEQRVRHASPLRERHRCAPYAGLFCRVPPGGLRVRASGMPVGMPTHVSRVLVGLALDAAHVNCIPSPRERVAMERHARLVAP
jgi:hypothetical protein